MGAPSSRNNDQDFIRKAAIDALIKMFKDNGNINGYSYGASMIARTVGDLDCITRTDSQKMGLACGSARREEKEERGNEWGWFSQMKTTLKRCGVWRNHEKEESLKGKAAEKDQTARETSGNCFSLEESTLLEKIEDVYEKKISLRRVYEVKKVISGGKPGREEFNNDVRRLQHLWVELQGLRSHVDGDATQEQETVLKLLASMESSYGWLVEMVLRGEQLPEMEEICGLIRRAYEIMRDDERLTMSRSESLWKPTGSRSESFQKLTMSRSEGSWRLTGSRSEGFRKKRRCRMLSKASINIGKGRKRVVGECSYSAYMGESVEDSGVLREQEKGSGADDRITRKEWREASHELTNSVKCLKDLLVSGNVDMYPLKRSEWRSHGRSEEQTETTTDEVEIQEAAPLDPEGGNQGEPPVSEEVHDQEEHHDQEEEEASDELTNSVKCLKDLLVSGNVDMYPLKRSEWRSHGEAERTTPLDQERGNGTESHEQVHNQEDSGQHNQEVTQEVESGAQSSGDGQREYTGSDESGTQSSGDWEVDPDGSNESGAQSKVLVNSNHLNMEMEHRPESTVKTEEERHGEWSRWAKRALESCGLWSSHGKGKPFMEMAAEEGQTRGLKLGNEVVQGNTTKSEIEATLGKSKLVRVVEDRGGDPRLETRKG
ncbi:hypothetical protein IGI04_042694 [Brassica rapa subsp. trilocularis]|uniref:Uncharacterized protein n=1 Tax=Brassica rapa subsp. trilocularis TaxID=1813537 RepID=A0ABQ7KIS1_BRACM|nr:hypothetical protein IGI04_042694 [Brassica rapa subsp. trilocularis]